MALPEDIERYVRRTFTAAEQTVVLELIATEVIHDGRRAEPRLMRCALLSSGGSVARLRLQLEQLKRDFRDVIVEGEYIPRNGTLVRIRNLSDPIAE